MTKLFNTFVDVAEYADICLLKIIEPSIAICSIFTHVFPFVEKSSDTTSPRIPASIASQFVPVKYLKENLEITNPKVHFSRIISVKIIDLGFAKEFSNLPKIKNNKHIPDVAGSYCFKAPELLSKPLYYYNEKIDIWCLGLVLKLLMARCESLFNYKDISDKVAADKEKGIVVKDVSKYMKKVVTEKIKRKDYCDLKICLNLLREKDLEFL